MAGLLTSNTHQSLNTTLVHVYDFVCLIHSFIHFFMNLFMNLCIHTSVCLLPGGRTEHGSRRIQPHPYNQVGHSEAITGRGI